jgi:hypothetical protein
MLFPHFADLVIERFEADGTGVTAHARLRATAAVCPGGVVSASVHSRYVLSWW